MLRLAIARDLKHLMLFLKPQNLVLKLPGFGWNVWQWYQPRIRSNFLTASRLRESLHWPLNLLKNLAANVDGDVTVQYTDTNAHFTLGDATLVCRLIDGKYPNYEAVIPKENPNKLVINRTQFLNGGI